MRRRLLLSTSTNLSSGSLGDYYFDFERVLEHDWPCDEAGVRLRPYPPPLFHQYHPMAIAEYALYMYSRYLRTGTEEYRERFLANAEWFLNNQTMAHDHIGLWIYDFRDTRAYNIRPPMYSAMVQGYGISVLLRAYDLTKKEAFIDAAERALCAYDFDVRHMGVRSVFRGYTFYEEAPSTPPSCILNGFVFALVGLYDFVRFNGNIKAKLRFDEGINTLVNCLTLYDTGYWSRYNLMYHNFIASRYYHDIHVLQLKLLYMITRQQVFGDYAGKWECYQKDLWCRTRSHACYYFYRFSYKLARIKALLSSI